MPQSGAPAGRSARVREEGVQNSEAEFGQFVEARLVKTMLLMKGNHRISVLNMPWYLDEAVPIKERTA